MFKLNPSFLLLSRMIQKLTATGDMRAFFMAENLKAKLYHRIGAGTKGVHGVHQKIAADRHRQMQRRRNGRYVW